MRRKDQNASSFLSLSLPLLPLPSQTHLPNLPSSHRSQLQCFRIPTTQPIKNPNKSQRLTNRNETNQPHASNLFSSNSRFDFDSNSHSTHQPTPILHRNPKHLLPVPVCRKRNPTVDDHEPSYQRPTSILSDGRIGDEAGEVLDEEDLAYSKRRRAQKHNRKGG